MSIRTMCNELIVLEKQDGTKFENIHASVQPPHKIYVWPTRADKFAIEEGDILSRTLPNGTVEKYIVEEPCFYNGFHGIEPHYQSRVRRVGSHPKVTPVSITTGDNSKVVFNSTDNSVNIQITNDNVWDKLVEVVKMQCGNNADLLNIVAEMKEAKGTPSFNAKYQTFVALAANHMTVLAPFIPALTSLLYKV